MDCRRGPIGFLPPFMGEWADKENLDISHIQGNLSEEAKRFCLGIFTFIVSTPGNSYGAEVGEHLKLAEINTSAGKEGSTCAETIFEVIVRKDMCNVFHILHGACAAYIVDLCSVSSLVALGMTLGFDGTGVSQSMNLIWHHPIRVGEVMRVISTSMSSEGRVRTMRCEIWGNKKLCISAVHSTVNASHKSYNNIKGKL